MDDGLKQRLIGAFVLLALAVIFIPVAFDRERIEPVDRKTQIPPVPHIEPLVIERAPAPVAPAEIKPAREMFLPNEDNAQSLSPEPTGFDSNGVPQSWVLQIASFRFEKHAEQLRDNLVKQGYSAYTRNAPTDKGKMTRVYVGPKLEKALLIEQKKEIDKKHKVSSILLKFEP